MRLVVFLVFFGALYIQLSNAGLTEKEKRNFVKRHNQFRSHVAKGKYLVRGVYKPPASNMRKLSWDDSLAAYAQAYANTCPKGHSKNRVNTGENLYWMHSSFPITNFSRFPFLSSDAWSEEFEKFGWPSNLLTYEFFNSGVGHATQMAWAGTHKLGCGLTLCNGAKTAAVVCQYQPMGNIVPTNIYEEGETCSKCPVGTSCEQRTGLCK